METGFDDHSTVAALETLMRLVILRRCFEVADPEAELGSWLTAIRQDADDAIRRGLTKPDMPDLVAVGVTLGSFADDLKQDYRSRRAP